MEQMIWVWEKIVIKSICKSTRNFLVIYAKRWTRTMKAKSQGKHSIVFSSFCWIQTSWSLLAFSNSMFNTNLSSIDSINVGKIFPLSSTYLGLFFFLFGDTKLFLFFSKICRMVIFYSPLSSPSTPHLKWFGLLFTFLALFLSFFSSFGGQPKKSQNHCLNVNKLKINAT